MRTIFTAFLATAAWLLPCVGHGETDLLPFAPPWNDSAPGATDISASIPKPAGALGPVQVRDGHLTVGEQRLRLFGVNLTAGANFPDHATADAETARMAKFGINAVRFHFLESSWGEFRLLDYKNGGAFDAEALDRFDYFFAKLKEHGIYANINLVVGRKFGVNDGIDPAIFKMGDKGGHSIGFFHAPHLAAQKAYADKLLGHRNAYTQLTYAEDPAVAIVEINNENGLMHSWLGGELDNLAPVFADDLRSQWNSWLAAHYPTTAALATAWQAVVVPHGGEMLQNGELERELTSWRVEHHGDSAVDARIHKKAAVLTVQRPGSANWHIQLNQPGLALRKGELYTIQFRASADRSRQMDILASQAHEPWSLLGLNAQVQVGPEEKLFAYTFTADSDDDNARIIFSNLSQAGAEFRIHAVSLRPGGRIGIREGESLEQRTMTLPQKSAVGSMTAAGRRDWIQFLWETERRYWQSMYHHLKDRIGVKAPVTGTIIATSTPNLMAEMDVVDTHAYWQHPHFPGNQWDRNNWIVNNISMVDHLDQATTTKLATRRVLGKPHMVSEYNHPAPNTHAGEAPLMLAVMAGVQDWDALFLYTYSHTETNTKAGRIPDFFDVGQHPTIMANVPAASLMFRRGDIAPGATQLLASLTPAQEIDLIASHGRAWQVIDSERLGVDSKRALNARIAIDITGTAPAPPAPAILPPDQVSWQVPDPGRGQFLLRTPRSKVAIGHLDHKVLDLGNNIGLEVGDTRTGWAAVSLILLEGDALDQQPRRALLTATGITENTAMGWKNAEHNTVGTDWGKAPSLVEPITAVLHLPAAADRLPTIQALDDRGQPNGQTVPATWKEGRAEFTIGPQYHAAWYNIDFGPAR